MKEYPRILTVQDVSCLGQCSAAVALPILSACGCEAVLLPTMVLSTHTGGLGTPVRRDLTADIPDICAHWKSQNICFDAIYIGYLGKKEQVELVMAHVLPMLSGDGILIVDPAMADHGKLYSGLDAAYAAEMTALCARADILLPNKTEACMLAEMPCSEDAGEEVLLSALQVHSGKTIVLTGVSKASHMTGCAIFDGKEICYVSHKKLPGSYHGTGDMFAAAFTGLVARGASVAEAAQQAGTFVCRAIEYTLENPAHSYGVKFERALPLLWK